MILLSFQHHSERRFLLGVLFQMKIHNILIFFAEKCAVLFIFSAKKNQHICVLLDVNFNESLTNDIVSFEQLGPDI